MKKNLFPLTFASLCLLVFITGCQKESNTLSDERVVSPVARPDISGGCRMTMYHYYDAIHDYNQVDRFTYKNGLLDEWFVSYGLIYKMDYDISGHMKGARVYDGNNLLYTIQFLYKSGRVVKEIWYVANTDVVDDEVINTYNQKGQMIKNESINYDYYTLYTYDTGGGVENFRLYIQDLLFIKGEYTSNQPYKNPFRSVHGLEYAFAYSNGGLFGGSRWYSSEKWILFDENGNPNVYYDLDPAQTVWTPAQQNYPQQADYTDAITGGELLNNFTYENCGGSGSSTLVAHQQNNSINRNSIGESIKAVVYGPKQGLKERINAFRKNMKK